MALAGSTTAGRGVETGAPPGMSTAEGCSTADGRSTADGLIDPLEVLAELAAVGEFVALVLSGALDEWLAGGSAMAGAGMCGTGTGPGARGSSVRPLATVCAPEADALLRPGTVFPPGAPGVTDRGITTEGWATLPDWDRTAAGATMSEPDADAEPVPVIVR